MTITSGPAWLTVDISDARNGSTCETCRALVEMTMSVLLNGSHIVGCPSCNWGAARARAGKAARSLTSASPLCALG